VSQLNTYIIVELHRIVQNNLRIHI
jgi:hypothetical protein